MARRPRIDQIGFYHVINRGVEKRDVYLKAGIADRIGKYRWAMSSRFKNLTCADFALIDKINFALGMSEAEAQKVGAVFNARLEVKERGVVNMGVGF